MQLKPIQEQVVAVVGASSGIGRETALQFARQGAKVAVSARSQEGLATLVDEIRNQGGTAIAIPADVSDVEQVKAIADQTASHFGRLDTWVHLAATSVFATFDKITPDEFKRVIEVNLLGQAYGAMAALPHLKREGRGALIHVSSVEARRSLPYQSPYSASKHGIEGFLDAMRLELLHEGWDISVTNVMPAVINTPFYDKTRSKLGVKPTGLPPYYAPSLVAEAILHAAQHPTRDVIVGDVGRITDLLQRISPALMDSLLLAVGFKGQQTQEPKTIAADNLYEPIPGYDRVEGDFKELEVPSLTDWIDRNPVVKAGAIATLALGAAVLWGLTSLGKSQS
jgi:NAD(P)-dependent dehydrogenase (short-subunit alcohol dehydrogenase family)